MSGESAARWAPAPDPDSPLDAEPITHRGAGEIVEFPVPASPEIERPPRPRRQPTRLGLSPALAGIVGGCVAVGLGLLFLAVPVAVFWVFITGDGLTEGLRAGASMWLGAQDVPVAISGVGVSLLPWGFGLLTMMVTAAVARWTSRIAGLGPLDRRQVTGLSVVAAITYGGLAAALAALATSGAVSPTRAALTGVFVLAVWWWSAAGRAGVRTQVIEAMPDVVRIGVRSGLTAGGLLIAAAALALAFSVVVHHSQFLAMVVAPGDALGIAVMVLLLLGYLPVAIGWSMAYLLGPGFTISAGVVLSPWSSTVGEGALPAIPWLAAVPVGATWITVMLVPVGLISGVLLVRRMSGMEQAIARASCVAVAAVTIGVLVGIVSTLSAGAAGTDRLAFLGPNSIASALIAALVVAAGAGLVEVARLVRRRFREE